jgi:hypothetical protein
MTVATVLASPLTDYGGNTATLRCLASRGGAWLNGQARRERAVCARSKYCARHAEPLDPVELDGQDIVTISTHCLDGAHGPVLLSKPVNGACF